MCLHISSRLTLRWPAALAASPRFCTSSHSLAKSATQGGGAPPPNGEVRARTASPYLPTCALHKSGSASWGTSDLPLMLSARPFVTRTGRWATRSVAMGRSCIGNDDRHTPSKTKLVESALLALEI
jgi:hypothetical protein